MLGLTVVYSVLVGLIVGSYLNVVVHRLPRGQSTVTPRSRCPSCRHPIRLRDNVPLVSWLLLRGRCRHCQSRISWRYPLVEASTAALFAGSVVRFGATPSAVVAALFCALCLALALIDAEHYLLPNKITYPGIVLGLALSPFAEWTDLRSSALGAVVGAGSLSLLIGLWYLLRRTQGMGWGDPKMLAMVGAFLGLLSTVLTLFLASLLGSLVGAVLLARRRADLQSRLPFGVYLAVGAVLSLFFGPGWVGWYLALWV
ncbi:MAG TPA: prepilin peptidase [Thermoanaerobaculia bacterium]|nr:prepilin peptidase [Thermoanaerobaculia bacterium]